MKEYTIKGNHPVAKRIDHIAIGWAAMSREIGELLEAGYEVTIEMRHLSEASTRPDNAWLCPKCMKEIQGYTDDRCAGCGEFRG